MPARVNIFSYRIYYELNPADGLPNYGAAAAISFVFLLAAVALLVAYNRAVRNADKFATITGKGYRQKRLELGRWNVPALVFLGAYLALAAVLSAAVLIWTSFFGFALPSLDSLPQISTAAYRALFADHRLWPFATRCW